MLQVCAKARDLDGSFRNDLLIVLIDVSEVDMTNDPKRNEWSPLKDQFDALVRGNSEPERPIEMFLDDQIRRRFVHWISSAAERKAKADNAYQGFELPIIGRFIRMIGHGPSARKKPGSPGAGQVVWEEWPQSAIAQGESQRSSLSPSTDFTGALNA
jgi:hypothetical protein